MLFHDSLDGFLQTEEDYFMIPDSGIISQLLLPEPSRTRTNNLLTYSITKPVSYLDIDAQGIVGDRHYGEHALSTGRERTLYPPGTLIRNHRQLFAISKGDCDILSKRMNVAITPELLGVNIVIERNDGKPYSLSALPINTYLVVAPCDAEEFVRPPIATLIHYVRQRGCSVTGKTIADFYSNGELNPRFKKEAATNRGIVCTIEYPVRHTARLEVGQTIFFLYPKGEAP